LIGVLTNPHSGKNRKDPGRRAELERLVGRHGVVRQTRDLDELQTVLHEFFDLGCQYWVCDGGDGTLHWMLSVGNRVARERGNGSGPIPLPAIVPANGGSIDFVAQKAGIRGHAPAVVRALVDHIERGEFPDEVCLDTLHLIGAGGEGQMAFDQLGFASAVGGVAQRFFDKLYQRPRVTAWGIVDVLAKSAAGGMAGTAPRALRNLLVPTWQRYADDVFEPTRARVEVDGRRLAFDSFSSLQVGSIDISLGGVVRTFRHAATAGVLHAQAISTSRLGVVANLPNIVMGTPIWGRHVFDGPARRLDIEALPGRTLDPVVDGELFFGLSTLRISRGPQVRVPAVCGEARWPVRRVRARLRDRTAAY
jgi:diacylglycerol kinase family enzyme